MSHLTVLPDGWLDMEESMRLLEKSQSTIERLVNSGEIKTKTHPVAGRKPMRLYRGEDVKRLQAEAASKQQRIALRPRAAPPAQRALTLPADGTPNGHRPEPPQAPWVSLEEAAERSGLVESYLRELVRDHKVAGVPGGPHGALRVLLESVLAFKG